MILFLMMNLTDQPQSKLPLLQNHRQFLYMELPINTNSVVLVLLPVKSHQLSNTQMTLSNFKYKIKQTLTNSMHIASSKNFNMLLKSRKKIDYLKS